MLQNILSHVAVIWVAQACCDEKKYGDKQSIQATCNRTYNTFLNLYLIKLAYSLSLHFKRNMKKVRKRVHTSKKCENAVPSSSRPTISLGLQLFGWQLSSVVGIVVWVVFLAGDCTRWKLSEWWLSRVEFVLDGSCPK